MKKNLQIEWLKLKNYAVFKTIAILFGIGVFLANFVVYKINEDVVSKVDNVGIIASLSPYNFNHTWETTSYVVGCMLILPAMLLIILTTNEYSYRTSRQNIIDGLSRKEFISTKIMLALLMSLACTILVILSASIFGLVTGSNFSLDNFSSVFYFLLKSISYNLIALFVSVIVKRTGFAIGLYFIYLFAENIISQLLNFWSTYMKVEKNIEIGSIGDYLPMNASDSLLGFPENPITAMAKNVMSSEFFWISFGFAIFYLLLFTWGTVRKFEKADL